MAFQSQLTYLREDWCGCSVLNSLKAIQKLINRGKGLKLLAGKFHSINYTAKKCLRKSMNIPMFDKKHELHLRMMQTFTQTQRQNKIYENHTVFQQFSLN